MDTKRYEGHSAGPWEIEERADEPCRIRAEYNGWDVADVFCTDYAIGQANARLIADAPAILAENERLRTALVTLVEHAQEQYPHFESERGQRDIKLALDALATERTQQP